MSRCYLDGAILPLEQARISPLDRGFIFGDAVYEVIPVIDGRIVAGLAHLNRLAQSLEAIKIRNPLGESAWLEVLREVINENAAHQGLIYVQVSRGVAPRDHAIPAGLEPTVFVMCRDHRPAGNIEQISAITHEDIRWARCDIKSTSLLSNVLLREIAREAGAKEALLIRDGRVTEGAASNIFVVHAGQVSTPHLSNEILPGVTRQLIIETLTQIKVPIVQQEVTEQALFSADEIWVTSSSRDIACVNTLDHQAIGTDSDYPLAHKTYAALQAHKRSVLI